eukprot:gene3791-4049_t
MAVHLRKTGDVDILEDRRRLLEHVMSAFKAQGGRIQLPIGMTTAEPWLLDAVDVPALLSGLQQSKGTKATIDLLLYCRKGSSSSSRTYSTDVKNGSTGDGAGGSGLFSDVDPEAAQLELPTLNLPQLRTKLSESEIKDLAYLVLAANCNQGAEAELLSTARSQLDVDERRAQEVSRLLALVHSSFNKMEQATGQLPVSELWTANLELPVCLLGFVLPKDFKRFRSFVAWKDTLSHVLLATLAHSVRDSWNRQETAGSTDSPTAQQLMARLKAALRRCDVRDADDFDESEYRAAARVVGQHAYAIVQGTNAGWAFPWGLRFRLCEMLLRGVFDTLDEASYIEDADQYLQMLQVRLWPLLGISPAMHNAGFAWIHFRQLSAIGGAGSLPGLVDVLAFAALSRGDSSDEVGDLLSAAVRASVDKELKRRLADQGPFDDDAAEVAALCSVVKQLAEEELQAWAVGFAGQLLESAPLAVAVLHQAVGARLTAWVSSIHTLDDDTCAALKSAMDLEPMLLGPVTSAADDCHHSATRNVLRASRSWDTSTQLLPVLQEWVSKQTCGFMTWVDRQLQQEDWKPLGTQQFTFPASLAMNVALIAHSASAREVRRIVMESLDALFGLDLPLPESIVRMHMEGIDNIMHRWLYSRGGSRWKKGCIGGHSIAEEAEAHMPGLPLCLPAPGTTSKKGIPFLESVRRIDQEPCFRHIEELSNEKLVVMMASLGYLLDTLQPIAEVVSQRWQEISSRGTARPRDPEVEHSNPFSSAGCDRHSSNQRQQQRHGSNGMFAASSVVDAGQAATWGGGWGAGVGAPGGAGLSGGQGSTAAVHSKSFRGQEHFASMLEAAEQSLRSGVVSVMRWLSVRVVWWEQRAGWCELLYRHRVIKCRLDWLLEGLSNTLGDVAALLPQEPRLDVAAALLKEAVVALERALLDGGPCRWYIPADVTHLTDDLEGLRRLFFAEGDGLQMQDINATLAGLSAVLKLMGQHTGPLVEAHRAARRAALLSGGGLATDPAARAAAAAGNTGSSMMSALSRSEGPWGAKADHAASKYLKESGKVPKARDETIGEALGRITGIHRH